ncbi:heavy metal-binding domain-containing protein [Acetanaerobacterium elongatum]|uniref:Uncharacterized conserved protein YbjQ, UPF0145 family n=1 Tax=Acetanaerobacterium elongatum TaxID=258515 RepID=A0A1G9WH08_9FIRM|nr:heavy metal-binding domain-containing protein [Acetanaerobacterium elongatum]SDM83335.1 Uncharacterized conserved protein YbjQ, UPF0145 family [Acetanaerobacterium elongatum]
MLCCICGKKQSSFISDFPLTEELNSYRICSACDQRKRDLTYSVGYSNIDEFNSIKEFFYSCSCEGPVREYLLSFISKNQEILENELKIRHQKEFEMKEQLELNVKRYKEFMITTTHSMKGYDIKNYYGIISAEIALGTGFLSELSANLADLLGTTSGLFAQKLDEARNQVIKNLIDNAYEHGCNAIIGLSFNYILFSGNMIGIVANGTGVSIVKANINGLEELNVLEKLASLRASNAITQEEYNEKKKIVLEKIK